MSDILVWIRTRIILMIWTAYQPRLREAQDYKGGADGTDGSLRRVGCLSEKLAKFWPISWHLARFWQVICTIDSIDLFLLRGPKTRCSWWTQSFIQPMCPTLDWLDVFSWRMRISYNHLGEETDRISMNIRGSSNHITPQGFSIEIKSPRELAVTCRNWPCDRVDGSEEIVLGRIQRGSGPSQKHGLKDAWMSSLPRVTRPGCSKLFLFDLQEEQGAFVLRPRKKLKASQCSSWTIARSTPVIIHSVSLWSVDAVDVAASPCKATKACRMSF